MGNLDLGTARERDEPGKREGRRPGYVENAASTRCKSAEDGLDQVILVNRLDHGVESEQRRDDGETQIIGRRVAYAAEM